MRSWLIGHARLSAADASKVVRAGRALGRFPQLASGFAAGEITGEQVDVVARREGLVAEEIAASGLDARAQAGVGDLLGRNLGYMREIEHGRAKPRIAPTELDVVGPGPAADVEETREGAEIHRRAEGA